MQRQEQWVLFDNFRRKMFLKSQFKTQILKSSKRNNSLQLSYQLLFSLQKSFLPRVYSSNKPVNRCSISGRAKGTLRLTQTSRFVFRKLAYVS